MAQVLKWQEKLVLACAALLFSVTSGLGLGPRDSASAHRSSSSHVMIVGKSGFELAAHRPYLRLVHASPIPVSLPLATGAYVAMANAAASADAQGDVAAPAAEAASACGTHTGGGGGGGGGCWTLYCSGSFEGKPPGQHTCQTCGYGTCGVCC